MKLTSSDKILVENKVLILYILDKVDKSISNDSLFKIVLSVLDMNYFYFQQFLLDLIEIKYIIYYEENSNSLYKITDEGKKALQLTESILPGIQKLKIDTALQKKVKDEAKITSDFIPEDEKSFSIKCEITENNKTIFSIKALAGSREQAKLISENWSKNASKIYPKILKLLTENSTE